MTMDTQPVLEISMNATTDTYYFVSDLVRRKVCCSEGRAKRWAERLWLDVSQFGCTRAALLVREPGVNMNVVVCSFR